MQYVPYWMMGRVTYLHHYVPAVLFLAPVVGVILDVATAAARTAFARATGVHLASPAWHWAWLWLAAVWVAFVRFAPLAYGMTGPFEPYLALQWRPGWHIADRPS